MSVSKRPGFPFLAYILFCLFGAAAAPHAADLSPARGYLQAGDEKAAVIELENALQKDPDNIDARLLLGETYLKLRDGASAEKEFRRIKDLGGDASPWQLNLVEALLLQGKFSDALDVLDVTQQPAVQAEQARAAALRGRAKLGLNQLLEAEQAFEQASKLDEGTREAALGKVQLAFARGDFDAAAAAADGFLQRFPDDETALLIRAELHRRKGEIKQAAERFEQVVKLDPRNIQAVLGHAVTMIGLGDIKAAKADLDRADEIQKDVAMSHYLRGVIAFQQKDWQGLAALAERRGDTEALVSWLEKVRDANPQALQPGLLLAEHYLAHNEPLKALNMANALSSQFPDNPQVLEVLGRAQALAGEMTNAVRTLEQLAQARPNDPEILYLLGGATWKASDLDGARSAFRKAIEAKPDFLNARVALTLLELQDKHPGEALDLAKQLERDYPKSAIGYQLEGAVQLAQNSPGDAATAFAVAYEREKSSAAALRLAQAYAKADRRKDAIGVLEGWLAERPNDMPARGAIALYYQLEGRDQDAIGAYEKVVTADHKNVLMLNNLAWLYQKQGDARALATARKAYDLDPSRAEVADTYGWLLLQTGKPQEALPVLQQAYVSYPTQSEIGYHVAVALNDTGRKDEAVKVLTQLLREDASFEQAKDAKALLEKLSK